MSILPGRLGPINGGRLRGGILSAANALPAELDVWRQGISFNPACVDTSQSRLWTCTDPDEATDKPSDAVNAPVVFEPFMVWSQRDCSTWMPPAELEELARIGLDRTLSQGVALQLQTNSLGDTSPSLNSTATDITPVTPVDIVNTLSGLIGTAVCDCGLAELIIHAPIRSLPFFIERQLVEWDEVMGVWMMGPHVMSFDCYSEEGPGESGSTDPDGSEIWIYVTGRIEWAIGPAEVVGRPESIIVRTNEALSLIEHLAILRFDPCCVLAAKAVIF